MEEKRVKMYHMGSKPNLDDVQVIFVASDESKGINDMQELYAQITIRKKQKTVEVLIPQDWSVKQKCSNSPGSL